MFTVKIINKKHFIEKPPAVKSIDIREWQSVAVWLPESDVFKDKVESLKQDAYNDYHSDLDSPEISGDELDKLIESQGDWVAFLTYEESDGQDNFYCVSPSEEVYITDRYGNTVHSIR